MLILNYIINYVSESLVLQGFKAQNFDPSRVSRVSGLSFQPRVALSCPSGLGTPSCGKALPGSENAEVLLGQLGKRT